MDIKNKFHTDSSFWLVRAEHLIIVMVCSVIGIMHIDQINWLHFIAAFLVIDLVGYIPGAIKYHRQNGGPIPAAYHHIYNIMHSYITAAIGVGIWAWLGGFEYAMLAIPIHLSGDRSLFGNFYKPASLSFEPVPYAEYKKQLTGQNVADAELGEGVLE